jgi:hypothetical protein
MKIQENSEGLKSYGTHQLLTYVDKLMGEKHCKEKQKSFIT